MSDIILDIETHLIFILYLQHLVSTIRYVDIRTNVTAICNDTEHNLQGHNLFIILEVNNKLDVEVW